MPRPLINVERMRKRVNVPRPPEPKPPVEPPEENVIRDLSGEIIAVIPPFDEES